MTLGPCVIRLSRMPRTDATTAITPLLPSLIEKPSGIPFKIIGTAATRIALDWLTGEAQMAGEHVDNEREHYERLAAANERRDVLVDLVAHRDHLAEQVTELQRRCTALLLERHAVRQMLDGALSAAEGEPRSANPYPHGEGSAQWAAAFNTVREAIDTAAKREPVVITVLKRTDDYVACLDEYRWEAGRTEDIAIAKLVINRSAELWIQVVFAPRGEAS